MKIKPRVAARIQIDGCRAFGKAFANLVEGSEHTVIDPPEEYKDKYPNGPRMGYWVQGIGEPVRVLPGEFIPLD